MSLEDDFGSLGSGQTEVSSDNDYDQFPAEPESLAPSIATALGPEEPRPLPPLQFVPTNVIVFIDWWYLIKHLHIEV